jgi:hypothetical protein
MKAIIKINTKRLKKPFGAFKKQMESEEIHLFGGSGESVIVRHVLVLTLST